MESYTDIEMIDHTIVQLPKYKLFVRNNIKNTQLESEWIHSRIEPQIILIDNKLFRVDSGSKLSPNSSSIFYSMELNLLSEEISMATQYIDADNYLVLIATFELTLFNIFNPNDSQPLEKPSDCFNGFLWFYIVKGTIFKNGILFLEYLDNDRELKTKEYKIE
jgi:hypothetical protein